jgi:hypothetical protein
MRVDQIQTLSRSPGAASLGVREAGDYAGCDSADEAGVAAGSRRVDAVFLHSGWRSCGTWLWDVLREKPGVRAYYEPLHEGLASLDRDAIGQFRPDSWGSGHGGGAPYFTEFGDLLKPGGGVAGYQRRFAFDDFFAAPGTDDPALRAYLDGLLAHAHREGRLPVLKFCRSLGRVGWLERQFPNALHVVMVRDPVAQWRSARLQMERDLNHYFVLAPFLILSRNATHKLLADAMRALDVSLPPWLSDDLGVTTTVCWRHVQKLDWAGRYRAFLALWAASAVAALSSDAMVIDADSLGDADTRAAAEHGLSAAIGLDVALADTAQPPTSTAWLGNAAEAEDAACASLAALAFVTAHREKLAPDHVRLLARKLTPHFAPPAGTNLPVLTRAAVAQGPVRASAPVTRQAPWLRTMDAVAYVALARASYPLRRAHFHLDRWLRR